MKLFIAIVCFFLINLAQATVVTGVAQPQDNTCVALQLFLSNGTCSNNTKNLCRNICTGEDITLEDCPKAPHCCVIDNTCVLKTRVVRPKASDFAKARDLFQVDYQNNIKLVSNKSETQARLFLLGQRPQQGSQFPPQGGQGSLFPFQQNCPKFPYTCPQTPFGAPIASPVNIPYCQRIPCSPLNPTLELNSIECLSRPGCYFDEALYAYRSVLGQAVLPGVPVCHLAIRNEAFQRKAASVKQQLGTWNPYLTQCLINENKDEIYGGSVGCQMLEMFEYFGHFPKRAGWQNINSISCHLINGCWRRSKGKGYCAYPVRTNNFNVRSANDVKDVRSNPRQLYGLPSCMPFSSGLTGGEFLTSYHQCLSTGCAINTDENSYWIQLYKASSQVPLYFRPQYFTMIQNNQVRPDNFKHILQQLSTQRFPYSNILGLGNQIPNYQTQNFGYPNVAPYSLNLNQSNIQSRSFSNFINPAGFFSGGISGLPNYQPPCPYQVGSLPGLPPLTGSINGCCDKPLCFIPRQQIHPTYSGVASYFSQWSTWSGCSVTCGSGGRQNRTRVCVGDDCDRNELTIQQQTCNERPCPSLSEWSKFSSCSKTCGIGTRSRSRVCQGYGRCNGDLTDLQTCSTGECPRFEYTQWSACSATCGYGQKRRVRKCVYGGAYGCPENQNEKQLCFGWSNCNRSYNIRNTGK